MSIITPELLTELLKGSLVPAADAIGNVGRSVVMIGGEWIKLWQMTNAVSIGQKAVEILKKRGITSKEQIRNVTTKFGILYLEGASVEDQPELRELWAKLLANAVDLSFPAEKISNAFFDVIKGLDPLDATVLDYLNKNSLYHIKTMGDRAPLLSGIQGQNFAKKYDGFAIRRELSLTLEDYNVSVHNLLRLQCIYEITKPWEMNSRSFEVTQYSPDEELIALTPFGIRFLEACIA